MARLYATAADYQTYTGQTPPDNIDSLLADASRFLESNVFRYCWYEVVPDSGLPANELVVAAFRDATCAQARWYDDLGDSTGAAGAGWGSVQLGSAQMSRSVTNVSGAASPSREIAPAVMDCLSSMDLTGDILVLGMVTLW